MSQSRLGGLSNQVLFHDCMNAQGWHSGTGAPAATSPAPVTPVPGADQLALALPPGFALEAIPGNLKNVGAAFYALNRALDIGVAVIPVPHAGVTDLMAFALTRKTAQVDRMKDATSSEITRTEVGGSNAVRYSVTGITGSVKISYVTTFIEGHDQIVIVNAWTGATNALRRMACTRKSCHHRVRHLVKASA
jgi:hypothetical protein